MNVNGSGYVSLHQHAKAAPLEIKNSHEELFNMHTTFVASIVQLVAQISLPYIKTTLAAFVRSQNFYEPLITDNNQIVSSAQFLGLLRKLSCADCGCDALVSLIEFVAPQSDLLLKRVSAEATRDADSPMSIGSPCDTFGMHLSCELIAYYKQTIGSHKRELHSSFARVSSPFEQYDQVRQTIRQRDEQAKPDAQLQQQTSGPRTKKRRREEPSPPP